MKISVIMPSYLKEYANSAKNRELKFLRSVDSFLSQTYENTEIIVVSDGCQTTVDIIKEMYANNGQIKLIEIDKQPLFSGNVRHAGINFASGEIVCYLDSDDSILPCHIECIVTNFENNDWVYFNHTWAYPYRLFEEINTQLLPGKIGTSSIAHKNGLASWIGCDGYGHDWKFIEKLIKASSKNNKIDSSGYLVRHIPGKFDN